MRSLSFPLDVVDDWPPVAVECLPFSVVNGGLELRVAPIFVKLAVGDVIDARVRGGLVRSWKYRRQSRHSTIWMAETKRGARRDIQRALKTLRDRHGCTTSQLLDLGMYAIDVPPSVAISRVDRVLAMLDANKVAIVYPVFRHRER